MIHMFIQQHKQKDNSEYISLMYFTRKTFYFHKYFIHNMFINMIHKTCVALLVKKKCSDKNKHSK